MSVVRLIAFTVRVALAFCVMGVSFCAHILPGNAQTGDLFAFRGFGELPADAVRYLATKAEPIETIVPLAGATVDSMITARCGDGLPLATKQALAEQLYALNPASLQQSTALETVLAGGMTLRFPFCALVRGPTVVLYAAGTKGLEETIKTHYPVWGQRTREGTAELTASYTSAPFDARRLTTGTEIVLPYSANWVLGRPRPGVTADEILKTLISFAPLYKENLLQNWVDSSAPFGYVGSLTKSDLAESDKCSEPTEEEEKFWPFDRGELWARLQVSRKTYADKHPGKQYQPSHVAIIDSGISRNIFEKLFKGRLFWINDDEFKRGPDNGKDDDDNGIPDDVYGIGAGYPTEGDFYALLDADEDQYNHGTKVATAIFGGAASLKHILEEPQPPPIIISFLRASRSLVTGTVRFEPTFIPTALEWLSAEKRNVSVVNLSLRHPQPYNRMYSVLYGRALFVAAAGNDGHDIEHGERYYPAYSGGMSQFPHVTVGAHDRHFGRLARSSFGKHRVDLLAPGCAIPVLDAEGLKVYGMGTSYAAPLVSLTAGILRSLGFDDPKDVRNRIIAATDFRVELLNFVWSGGTLNIPKAVSIFDDIVDIRKVPDRRSIHRATDTMYGDLVLDRGEDVNQRLARFCRESNKQRILRKSRVVKVSTFVNEKGNSSLRYLADHRSNFERTLVPIECELDPRETHLRFKVKSPGLPDRTEIYTITDIADIVPRRQ